MKSIRTLPFIGLFLFCLSLGFLAGRRLASPTNAGPGADSLRAAIPTPYYPVPNERRVAGSNPSVPLPQKSIEFSQESGHESGQYTRPSGNGQLNLLAIGVDHLDASQTTLESLWLIVFSPDMPHFMFLPIYPTVPEGIKDGSRNEILVEKFELDPTGGPSQNFLEELATLGIWWDQYILLDEIGTVNLINLFGNIESARRAAGNNFPLSSYDSHTTTIHNQKWGSSIITMPPSQENPAEAQRAQYRLLQEVCLQSASASPVVIVRNAFKIIRSSSEHIQTDLEPSQITNLWHDNQDSQMGFSCEFPSLAAVAIQ